MTWKALNRGVYRRLGSIEYESTASLLEDEYGVNVQ
jgi:hypothetical protein